MSGSQFPPLGQYPTHAPQQPVAPGQMSNQQVAQFGSQLGQGSGALPPVLTGQQSLMGGAPQMGGQNPNLAMFAQAAQMPVQQPPQGALQPAQGSPILGGQNPNLTAMLQALMSHPAVQQAMQQGAMAPPAASWQPSAPPPQAPPQIASAPPPAPAPAPSFLTPTTGIPGQDPTAGALDSLQLANGSGSGNT
jgi:hypothetical protein